MWSEIFNFDDGAIDFLFSDKPVEAMQYRNVRATKGLSLQMFRTKDELYFKVDG